MAPARNQPCPCGSGRKYKRCCFASGVYEEQAAESPERRLSLAQSALSLGDLTRARNALAPLLARRSPPETALDIAARIAMQARDYALAGDYFEQLTRTRPDDPARHYNLGTALGVSGHLEEAVAAFRRALALKPDMLVVYPNLGHALRDLGRTAEAIECYAKVFGTPGVDAATMSQILLSMHFFSESDHEQLFAMHRQLGAYIEDRNARLEPRPLRLEPGRKVRIGYLSPRFSREIVGYFFKPLLEHHDRGRFEVFLYNATSRTDDLTGELAALADHWVEMADRSDPEICRRIAADDIDILVDLAGHAPENRIGVFARKPAPVQVSMVDYFDTTGLSTMDYWVSDRFSSPAGGPQRFTETLLYLQRPRLVYQPPDYAPEVTLRSSMDAPLVFGSFNRHQKIVPKVVAAWSRVLQAVPGSQLVLKGRAFGAADGQRQFRSRFADCGVDPARLEFRGNSPHADMLAEYGDIDIALDTFPYNGGLTTCEALWMGTPVLTVLGERVISRQTAGMLASMGLEGFTAADVDGMVELARRWAARRASLRELRLGLRHRMAASPLTDAAAYAADFEGQLLEILEQRSSAVRG
jgi:predicted O-linked N-acetylglucosamine transferase (SPINDLY family)